MSTTSNKTLQAHQKKINQLTDLNNEKDSLLVQALAEITSLRNQNYNQSLRLQMFDDLKQILHTQVQYRGEGLSSPDISYQIRQHLNK